MALAVTIGLASARFLGTSSPKIMVTTVPNSSPIAAAIGVTAPCGTPSRSSGPSMRSETAGSARKPMARLVTVIPTWAPESWVESDAQRPLEPLRPGVARGGLLLDLGAVDGDEGELGRDEESARRDECEREREQQQGGVTVLRSLS